MKTSPSRASRLMSVLAFRANGALPTLHDIERRRRLDRNGKEKARAIWRHAPLGDHAGDRKKAPCGGRQNLVCAADLDRHHRAIRLQVEQLAAVGAPSRRKAAAVRKAD